MYMHDCVQETDVIPKYLREQPHESQQQKLTLDQQVRRRSFLRIRR